MMMSQLFTKLSRIIEVRGFYTSFQLAITGDKKSTIPLLFDESVMRYFVFETSMLMNSLCGDFQEAFRYQLSVVASAGFVQTISLLRNYGTDQWNYRPSDYRL